MNGGRGRVGVVQVVVPTKLSSLSESERFKFVVFVMFGAWWKMESSLETESSSISITDSAGGGGCQEEDEADGWREDDDVDGC